MDDKTRQLEAWEDSPVTKRTSRLDKRNDTKEMTKRLENVHLNLDEMKQRQTDTAKIVSMQTGLLCRLDRELDETRKNQNDMCNWMFALNLFLILFGLLLVWSLGQTNTTPILTPQ